MMSSVEAVDALLNNPLTDIAAVDNNGMIPLHYAKYLGTARALLGRVNATRSQELVNTCDRMGRTPLHSLFRTSGVSDAAVYDIATIFVEAGADRMARTLAGQTPLEFAMRWRSSLHESVFELLSPDAVPSLYRRLCSIRSELDSRGFNVSNDALLELDGLLRCPIMMEPFHFPVLCADSITVGISFTYTSRA
jgi:hypothetical protein